MKTKNIIIATGSEPTSFPGLEVSTVQCQYNISTVQYQYSTAQYSVSTAQYSVSTAQYSVSIV